MGIFEEKVCTGCGAIKEICEVNFAQLKNSNGQLRYRAKCRICFAKVQKIYNASPNGKARRKAYNASPEGKAAQKAYYVTSKGMTAQKAAQKKYNATSARETDSNSRKKAYMKTIEGKAADKAYRKNRRKNDIIFRMRKDMSKAVWKGLKRNGGSKAGESCIKYLDAMVSDDYIELLWRHLENQFEPWMTKDNQGSFDIDTWDDNDPTTWRWQLDHITPHSAFKYETMDCEEFRNCWALENLRPLSAKLNVLENDNRTDEQIKTIKVEIKLKQLGK